MKEKVLLCRPDQVFYQKLFKCHQPVLSKRSVSFVYKLVKKHNNIKQSLISVATIKFEENIRTYARWLDDNELLLRLGNSDFVTKEVMYHAVCRVNYQNKAGRTAMAMKEKLGKEIEGNSSKENENNMRHTSRDIHCKSFEGICSYIEDIIIDSKEVHLTSSINFQYKMLLIEIGGEEFIESNFTTQKLEMKLLKHFGDKIVIHKGKTRSG